MRTLNDPAAEPKDDLQTAVWASKVSTPPAGSRVGPAPRAAADFVIPTELPVMPAASTPISQPSMPWTDQPSTPAGSSTRETEVIELPSSDAPPEAILAAVLHQPDSGLAACPLRPPMCPEARLAVARDRTLVLMAVARQGLGDLRAIGQAYQWLVENRVLIGMAIPQFALDPNLAPKLRLLVDQADVSAAALQPLMRTSHITLQAYRRLRWGGKSGLLLEAA
jgi:hypothetical protein